MSARRPLPIHQPDTASEVATLHNPWLTLGRVVWLLVAVAVLAYLVSLVVRGSRILLAEPLVSDSYVALSSFISYPSYARLLLTARYSVLAVYFLTGVFIFWRASNTVIGLVTSLTVILLPSVLQLVGPDPSVAESLGLPFATQLVSVNGFLTALGFLTLLVFFSLFPTGRFPSPRLARLSLLTLAISIVTFLGLTVIRMNDEWAWELFVITFLVVTAVAIGGAIYRYVRVSGPTERLQTQWVLASFGLALLWQMLVGDNYSPFRSWSPWAAPYAVFQLVGSVIVAILVPIAIARAILRFHLWDIDVIVRKTLIYSLLTGVLLLIYLASVLFLQRVFTSLTGQDSEIVTILSTLLIAALFLPLRRRIQLIIDRRFFRSKYDAARVLEEFASTARDETDLDTLTAELLRVIQETMQPSQLSIWLRDDTPLSGVEGSTQNIRFRGYVTNQPSNPPQQD